MLIPVPPRAPALGGMLKELLPVLGGGAMLKEE
jgi:hypothetical protein